MALFRYFERAKKEDLPDPQGTLSKLIPSSSIAAANSKVQIVLESGTFPSGGKKRGPYVTYTPEQKALIGKRAAECGVVSTIRHYAQEFPKLRESTVRDWRNAYSLELKKKRKAGIVDAINIDVLPGKKRGRPLLLGEELDRQVQAYLTSFRESGAVVNTAIAMGCAEGIVMSIDSNLLASNGGHISLTKDWGKNLLHRMGFVKRRASTKAKVSVTDFEEIKAQFLLDLLLRWKKYPFL